MGQIQKMNLAIYAYTKNDQKARIGSAIMKDEKLILRFICFLHIEKVGVCSYYKFGDGYNPAH